MTPTVPFLDLAAGHSELETELDQAFRRVLASGRYVLGPELQAFEAEFSQLVEAAHCVGVANGLDALELILRAQGIGPGDEVIVPAHTFIATWLAVSNLGARPIGVDPNPRTFNLEASAVEPKLTPRTRAIVVVHLYGQPADMGPLNDLAQSHRLPLIEDAAQAHGARYRGRRCGGLSTAAAFSFYPAKNLGAFGDGGAVTTQDADLADKVRLLRNYGSRIKYHHETLGRNSRLDELQAAFLRVKLRRLDRWNKRRHELARYYLDHLQTSGEMTLPFVPDGTEPSWHLFVVRHPDRDGLRAHLLEAGVEAQIHYPIPPGRSAAYAQSTPADSVGRITSEICDEVLSLPMGPHVTPEQRSRVVAALLSFGARRSRSSAR